MANYEIVFEPVTYRGKKYDYNAFAEILRKKGVRPPLWGMSDTIKEARSFAYAITHTFPIKMECTIVSSDGSFWRRNYREHGTIMKYKTGLTIWISYEGNKHTLNPDGSFAD